MNNQPTPLKTGDRVRYYCQLSEKIIFGRIFLDGTKWRTQWDDGGIEDIQICNLSKNKTNEKANSKKGL